MGNKQSILQQINIYEPPFSQLQFKQPGNKFKIYEHVIKKYQVMTHRINHSEKQLPIIYENFKARYQHHYLVSTLFLHIEDNSTCGGSYQTIIYYQRIFTNLTKIKDIPFNDVLHFYAVAFKGFHILFKRFGYFQIYQDMFHLGQDSKLKVWCNKDISKNQPETYLIDLNGTQEDMIRKILFIIDENTDHQNQKINIKNLLTSYGIKNFQMANQSLRQICRKHNVCISERVNCLTSLPSQEVQAMLDLYTSNVYRNQNTQQLRNIEMTFNPTLNNNENVNDKMKQTPQFTIPQNTSQPQHIQKFEQAHYPSQSNLGFSNMSIVKNSQKRMLQTFNNKPQIPIVQKKKGLDMSINSRNNFIKPNEPINHNIVRNYSAGPTRNVSPSPTLFHQPKIINNSHISVNNVKFNNIPHLNQPKNQAINIQNSFNHPVVNQSMNQPQNVNNFPNDYNSQPKSYIPSPKNYLPQQKNYIPLPKNYFSQQKNNFLLSNNPQNRSNYHLIVQNPKPITRINGTNISFHHKQPIQQTISLHNDQRYLNNSKIDNNPSGSSIVIQKVKNNNLQSKDSSINKRPVSATMPSKIQLNKFRQDNLIRSRKSSGHLNKSLHANQKVIKFNPALTQTPPIVHQNNQISHTYNSISQKDQEIKNIFKYEQKNKKQTEKQRIKQKYEVQKNYNYLKVPNNQNNIGKTQILKKPLDFKFSDNSYNFNGLRSSSSRYTASNKEININTPQLNNKKKIQIRKVENIFDPKIIQLQSYAQSINGTFNSLRNLHLGQQNSTVLQIIGRQKKDSITSAFGNDEMYSKYEQIKQFPKKENSSFTDPKIIQLLKKPVNSQSTKNLINQLNNLKRVSRAGKQFESNNNNMGYKKIQTSKQNNNFNIQKQLNKYHDSSKNLVLFPSLSNLSEIKKIQDPYSSQQQNFNDKVNSTLTSNKNINSKFKKSRFNQQMSSNFIKDDNNNPAINDLIEFDYKKSKYDYPSLTKKQQIPIKDNQQFDWKNYGISMNRTNDNSKNYKTQQQKNNDNSFNLYQLGSYNSNQSLASLQWQLNKKRNLLKAHLNDRIQEVNESSQTLQNSSSIKIQQVSSNRKYNPTIDPQINKDLQRLRQLRKMTQVK